MDRRSAVAAVAFGVMTAPVLAAAQQPKKVFRVGIASSGINPRSTSFMRAFEQRLRELGWVEGQNLAIEYREGQSPEETPVLVAELVREKVDLLFSSGTDLNMKATVEATRSIPIVMVALNYDPVERGYIKSLAHPGSNVTGVFARNLEVGAKQLELLKQAFPNATRVGVLWDIFSAEQLPSIKTAAARLRVEVESVEVRPPYDLEVAFSRLRDRRVSAVLAVGSPVSYRDRVRIAQLAINHGLPMVGGPSGAEGGNLISFGFDLNELYRSAADYVDRILKGAKPADLAVEQPTKFQLIINLKTAKALGVTIPQSLLLRADQIIE